jgi:hypothetical protein
MDWRFDSSSRAPSLQVWSSEFNLQSHQKTNKQKKTTKKPKGVDWALNIDEEWIKRLSLAGEVAQTVRAPA